MNQKCFSFLANYSVPRISFDICNLENTDLSGPLALKGNLLHGKKTGKSFHGRMQSVTWIHWGILVVR